MWAEDSGADKRKRKLSMDDDPADDMNLSDTMRAGNFGADKKKRKLSMDDDPADEINLSDAMLAGNSGTGNRKRKLSMDKDINLNLPSSNAFAVPDRMIAEETQRVDLTNRSLANTAEFENLTRDILNSKTDPYGEILNCVTLKFESYLLPSIVGELILFGFRNKQNAVVRVLGRVIGSLVKEGKITPDQFFVVFRETSEKLLKIYGNQCFEFWAMMSKFIWAMNIEYKIMLDDLLHASAEIVNQNCGLFFLFALFKEKIKISNDVHALRELCNDVERMDFNLWLRNDVYVFIDCVRHASIQKIFNIQKNVESGKILTSLSDLIDKKTPFNQVMEWIEENVENKNSFFFIDELVEAVYTYALRPSEFPGPKFDNERFNTYSPLLTTYIVSKHLEFEYLCAIQNLMDKWEHPHGIALEIFQYLSVTGAVQNVSFLKWMYEDTIYDGKLEMSYSLKPFYANLQAIALSDNSKNVSMSGDY